jgi:hypothetical protein
MFNDRFAKVLLLCVAVLLAAQLACAVGGNNDVNGQGGGADSAALAATEQALKATQDALDAESQQVRPTQAEPTEIPPTKPAPTEPAPTQPAPTQPQPTAEPAQQTSFASGDLIYFTDFDGPEDWEDGWIQFASKDMDYRIYKSDGYLYVEVPDQYSTVYAFYEDLYFARDQADVYVETYFMNLSTHNINNVSLICRATDAGWYEFSMVSGGLWQIWKYDSSVGYTMLTDGGIPDLDYDAPHYLGITCIGDTLTFYVDGEMLKNGFVDDSTFREGQVGLSVYADVWEDVIIEFDYFGVEAP